jgi:FkbM family methyltransferase
MSIVQKWLSERGDWTYRLNYDLNKDSIVIDAGGYQGWFAEQIYNKYKCNVYVFEPVKSYYDLIVNKFKNNPKIKVFHYGVGGVTETVDINLQGDGTSVHTKNNKFAGTESIKIVNILDCLKDLGLENVDLLKLNIEGEEYPLLESLIKNNELKRFSNIQVQFHNFFNGEEQRRNAIRKSLIKDFTLDYDFEFVWEGWKQIN